MSQRVRALRGFNDVLPDETPWWRGVMQHVQHTMDLYGFSEIKFPVMEDTALFKRSVGEATDIVEKEMFSFQDREKTSMSLRPEGTASCVRAGIDGGLLHNQQQRLWYVGPMFRHEKPQKGRYRQFEQVGVEAYGMAGPDIDLEVIAVSARLLKAWGVLEHVQLELNTLGSSEARANYRQALVDFLTPLADQLDEDSQRRLQSNPLRILDTKVASTRALIADAPTFEQYLDEDSSEHFEQLQAGLQALGIPFVLNPQLVRGLDYYSRTVFEWTTDKLGSQGTVCAGGRYDALVEQLGGGSVPAIGFASGLDRIILLRKACGLSPDVDATAQVYICGQGNVLGAAAKVSEELRDAGIRVQSNAGGGKLKAQFKRADKSGAALALIIDEQEWQAGGIRLKPLRGGEPQQLKTDNYIQAVTALIQ